MTSSNASNYSQVTISCSNCNNTFESQSTHDGDIKVEVCSNCHPVYTGEQRTNIKSNQLDKFNDRYNQ